MSPRLRGVVYGAMISVSAAATAAAGCNSVLGIDDGAPLPTGEQCFNSVDDDGDGFVDCDDPECASVASCAPAFPTGWDFGELFASADAGCDDGYVDYASGGVEVVGDPKASCSPCSCGVECGAAVGSSFNDAQCTAPVTTVPIAADGGCSPLPYPIGGVSVASLVVSACEASGGDLVTKPAHFKAPYRACSIASVGVCGDGTTCVPKTSPRASTCLFRAGDAGCPPPYSKKIGFDTHVVERTCAPCACSDPADGGCTVNVTLASDPVDGGVGCTKDLFVAEGGMCTALPTGMLYQSYSATLEQDPSACTPSDGGRISAAPVTSDQPVTACCLE